MLLATYDTLRVLAASLLVGVSIKIMDDCIDRDYDQSIGAVNYVQTYGIGVIAYGMLALLAACLLHLRLSIGLFTAAYVIGMGFEHESLFPSNLSARGESIVVVLFSAVAAGMRLTIMSLCIMAAAQLIDDWCDENKGHEYFIAALGLGAVSVLADSTLAPLVLFAYALFFALERWWQRLIQ